MIFHWRQWKWQTHFTLLQEMSLLSLASFCQSRAVLLYKVYGDSAIGFWFSMEHLWAAIMPFLLSTADVESRTPFSVSYSSIIEAYKHVLSTLYLNWFIKIHSIYPSSMVTVSNHTFYQWDLVQYMKSIIWLNQLNICIKGEEIIIGQYDWHVSCIQPCK